jgi:hypothetical protein
MLMAGIVGALEKAGKTDEALQVANEGLESARKIDNAYYRSRVMANIVEALTKAGKTDEAFESAQKIDDAGYRSQAMVGLAEAMARNREADKAESTLDEAQRAAQQITWGSEKSTRLAAIAIGVAKLHHYRLARDIADLCTSPSSKLAAYTAIFREYQIERNPDLEKMFKEEKQK